MKKVAKIIGIVLVCIIAAMAIIPLAFKDKIKEVVLSEAGKYIHAEFGFDGIGISLFREFPQASVSIEGFWLRGKDEFAHDTLAYVGRAEAAVNVMSIFGDSGFDITKILLADTYLKAIVLEDGRVNWDIISTTSEEVTDIEEPEDTTNNAFRILLQKVSVDNLNVIYDDRQGGMYAQIEKFGATCRGDMASDHALLTLKAAIEALTFKMDGVPMLSKAHIGADINIDADFANNCYTLKENTLSLNAIHATIDGWASLPTDAPMSMDLKLNTSEISFKELLSLVPAIYAKDFEDLKAEGIVSLHAFAKGELTDTTLPQFEAALKVSDGNFRYPTLPAGIDNIQISARASNPGGDIDLTTLDVNRFSFSMLGNPFALTAQVKTPTSDPNFSVTAKGTLNLGKVKDVFPLEDITLNGIIKANMSFGGRLSYIEKELYDRFEANGTLELSNMKVLMEGLPEIAIEQSTFAFTPRYLNLSETRVLIGTNDVTADCRFENYMAFVLKDETLKGQLNLKSNYINLNDFMTSTETEENKDNTSETSTDDTEEDMSVLVVPKNIDFNMNVDMTEILFDSIALHNLKGKLIIKDGTATMNNLSAQTMGGNVVINGNYSTAQSETEPQLKASFALNEFSFAQTFKELDMVRQMAPIFENLNGNFSGKIAVETKLDDTMSPQLERLTANGNINTRNLNLSDVAIMGHIADVTGREELKDLRVKDLNIDFAIEDGRVRTKPFDIKMGDINLTLSGSTGLDKTIDYAGRLKLPTNANNPINTIDFKIGGEFSDPKISIDAQSMARQAAETVTAVTTEKAIEAVSKQLGVDLSNTEKQKEELVKTAEQAAQRLVIEAEKQKSALVSKAGSNALKKLAAEKAGDVLITEAKEKGAKLIAEAEKKGNELIEKASKE